MKLVGLKEIKGKIILRSGLHIGAGDTEMKIGGTDNPVIKHPHTLEPYIPGSSLKGKVRALLEMRSGLMLKTKGAPVSLTTFKGLQQGKEKNDCEKILKLFGSSGADTKTDSKEEELLGPTRVSFADCSLNEEWRKNASKEHLALTEVKSENTINRIEGTATNPRSVERVPEGVKFDFVITLKQLNPDENLEDFLFDGLKLLEMDALGGSGSRGYGRIKLEFDDPKLQAKFNDIKPL